MMPRRRIPKPTSPWLLGSIVEVTWYDSFTTGRWDSADGLVESRPLLCRPVGYLLKRDARVIQLVQQQSECQRLADSITIPRACVLRVRRVR